MSSFWEYCFSSDALCLGERVKKGTYRPTLTTSIPYSQITGALRATFGDPEHERELHAVGTISHCQLESQVSSLRDVASSVAKIPLEFALLTRVKGKVYVPISPFTQELPSSFTLTMGALRSKGLGLCLLNQRRRLEISETQKGRLTVRLPDSDTVKACFAVGKVIMPVWGYLFEPDPSHESGEYVLSLFEGSIVEAPYFLLRKEVSRGDH